MDKPVKPYRPPSDAEARIIGLDDDAGIRHLILTTLKCSGFRNVSLTDNVETALDYLENEKVHLLILDWEMPNMTGLEFLSMVRPRFPELPIMMLTSINDTKKVMSAIQSGATDYVVKPWKSDELIEKVRKAIKTRHNRPLPVNTTGGFI